MVEMLEYAPYLVDDTRAILDGGELEAIATLLEARAGAMEEIGGTLARDADRSRSDAGRLRETTQRLAGLVQEAASRGDDYSTSAVANVLTGLYNLHLAIDSSLARSAFAPRVTWAMDGLVSGNATTLVAQIQSPVLAALGAEWNAAATAQNVRQAIDAIYSYEGPEGVSWSELLPTELPDMLSKLQEAWTAVGSYAPTEGRRDDSQRMADWLQIPLASPVGEETASHGSTGGGDAGGGQPQAPGFDWNSVDLDAMHRANGRVCKAASSSERLAFVGLTFIFCIGPDHPQPLLQAIAGHPDAYSGTVQVKSARIGAGTMVVTGAPADQQPNVQWAISQFSRKDVEFR